LTEPALLVAPLGIEPHDPGATSNPHDRPYFLTIGTIEARKNHILLLRVWEMLRSELGSRTPDLVVIGRRGWEAEQTLSLLDTSRYDHGRIIELSQCDDARLVAWIDHAVAVLMPSHSEGYGLPVVESLARGTPVIASDLPVYHEIAGGVPLLLHSEDEHAWGAAIRGMTSDGTEAQRQRAALRDYKAPSWSSHFDLVEAWLTTISDPCHAPG
jgi:glycosyltransferase involved in cell wall biosynthesis